MTWIKTQAALICFTFLTIGTGSILGQGERILNYDTQIEVGVDRSITVTEFIEVNVQGDKIKRGITRFLPTSRNLNDRSVRVKYELLEVEKNGEPEPYLRDDHDHGILLRLGQREVLLDPGVYQYKIKYRVPNQIGFFDSYDEIYWNAIGNEVEFEIEKASCRVRLPNGATLVQESAYTGAYGQQGKAFTARREGLVLDYRTSQPLQPGEGLTVAVGIEKGIIQTPGIMQRLGTLLLVLIGSIFLVPYYIYTWWKYGRDPATPASYPIWEAPDGLSAASINYIERGSHHNKSFTASVVHLAIQGYLRIEEMIKKGFLSKSRQFELIKLKPADDALPAEEARIMQTLFSFDDRVLITGKYDKHIASAFTGHKSSLSAQHRSFIWEGHNAKFLVIPVLITLAVVVVAGLILYNSPYNNPSSFKYLLIFGALALGSLGIYGYLIKKPTPAKLDLRARIKGFKMYLELAEKDRLRLLNPPTMSPEHFEGILPYAFALGVEHQWTEKFKRILDQAQYQPQWHNSTSPLYFSDHFGRNFTESVSSAATKPSDSGSGSGGGGFSGGGGGGGGVGGW